IMMADLFSCFMVLTHTTVIQEVSNERELSVDSNDVGIGTKFKPNVTKILP
ncbi:Hypothetical protein FKW44_012308, partial [Caligus rogercresseyi]